MAGRALKATQRIKLDRIYRISPAVAKAMAGQGDLSRKSANLENTPLRQGYGGASEKIVTQFYETFWTQITEIFKKLGSATDTALLQTVVVGVVNVTFTVVAFWTVDRLGRRPLMIIGAGGMGVCLWAFGLAVFLEGLPYFISPSAARRLLAELSRMSDGALRTMGLTLMVVGLLVAYLALH